MANLPQVQNISQVSSKWKAQLDPVLKNLLIQGQLLSDIAIANGSTVVNHKLGRQPVGWFLVSPKGAAAVYEAAYQPNPELTLTLTSNAAITSSIWVF